MRDGGEDKILQVATAVGCGNNPQYFSQMFKKTLDDSQCLCSDDQRGKREVNPFSPIGYSALPLPYTAS